MDSLNVQSTLRQVVNLGLGPSSSVSRSSPAVWRPKRAPWISAHRRGVAQKLFMKLSLKHPACDSRTCAKCSPQVKELVCERPFNGFTNTAK